MSRQRQSSVTSVLKSTGQNGHIDSPASPYTTSQRLTQTASTSQIPKLPFQLSTIPSQNSETSLEREADELFAHKTIAEVKIVQTQLRYLVNLNMEHAYDEIVTRSDAEAKQEELRLMVGERYRDLLQASTSIISIAATTKKVMEALKDTKTSIRTQQQPARSKVLAQGHKQDQQLRTLQLLSAHIKLLLDAPEHLWRLIEQQKFFQAAWLFLLARVVHRALIRYEEDEEDETNWSTQGISVIGQFPVIQRQWDAVSHFKNQISHKATSSLRNPAEVAHKTCATLLSLYLLESRPMIELLSSLLSQRSKTLSSKLSKKLDLPSEAFQNGHVTLVTNTKSHRQSQRRLVKLLIEASLELISDTVITARDIFRPQNSNSQSMIELTLEYVHSESSDTRRWSSLPMELLITTQTLLTTLPSSHHLLLLPPNLQGYKPYVDLTSSASPISEDLLVSTLDEWFRHSTDRFITSAERWLSSVECVRDLWSLRGWSLQWFAKQQNLGLAERQYLINAIDTAVQERTIRIWHDSLSDMRTSFVNRLQSALQKFKESHSHSAHPMDLFNTDSLKLPTSPTAFHSYSNSTIARYRVELHHQLDGRDSVVKEVLGPLETSAAALMADVTHILQGGKEESLNLALGRIRDAYDPAADDLCSSISKAITDLTAELLVSRDSNRQCLCFVIHVADQLIHYSLFLTDIQCQESIADGFRLTMERNSEQIISHMRHEAVREAVDQYQLNLSTESVAISAGNAGPSPALMEGLLALTDFIATLGIHRDPQRLKGLSHLTLQQFVNAITSPSAKNCDLDLRFLKHLFLTWPDHVWPDIHQRAFEQEPPSSVALLERSAEDSLLQTHTLLAHLLPPDYKAKVANSERLVSNTDVPVTLHVAAPSARFGMILVGDSQ